MSDIVKGHVAPGYERVREIYQQDFARGSDASSQLCVYVKGDKVVDLWGSHGPKGDPNYGPDSLQIIFSSGKSVASICMACLVDKGLLKYDDRVSKHWPEFAQNGKENLKICDILRHEGGMPWFHQSLKVADLVPENLKKNHVGKVIEEENLMFPPESYDSPREYHAATRGYILNEIFRRVEPSGRTMGEFLREDINNKMGVDIHFGAQESELSRVADLKWWVGMGILQSMWPQSMGRKIAVGFWDIMKTMTNMKPIPGRGKPPPILDIMESIPKTSMSFGMELYNNGTETGKQFKMGEHPSYGTLASARGMAKLAAAMADRGQMPEGGPMVMSAETWDLMHDNPTKHAIPGFKMDTNFTQGGVNLFGPDGQMARQPEPHEIETDYRAKFKPMGFVGWMGLGGSVLQWHPELEIGFGYAPTLLHFWDLRNGKAEKLQRAVVDCIKDIKK